MLIWFGIAMFAYTLFSFVTLPVEKCHQPGYSIAKQRGDYDVIIITKRWTLVGGVYLRDRGASSLATLLYYVMIAMAAAGADEISKSRVKSGRVGQE